MLQFSSENRSLSLSLSRSLSQLFNGVIPFH